MLPFHLCSRARCKRLLQTLSLFVALGTATMILAAPPSFGVDTADTHAFHISAGSLAEALQQFIAQSGLQILYDPSLVNGRVIERIDSVSTPRAVLDSLLRNTGLTYQFTSPNTVVIKRARSAAKPQSPKALRQPAVEKAAPPAKLQTVTVTGSRLPAVAMQGPQEVKVYTAQQIAQSGQTTVGDFLNTLPAVSTIVDESGNTTYAGAQTVRLRGLPVGSTLVLLNGRVVGGSSANEFHGNPFDLNFIPISAIERIEVVPEAASAVYGSDAIGGVVNIILRKNLDGGEFSVTGGRPTEGGYSDTTTSIAWGKNFSHGNISLIASYQKRSELSAAERQLTANQDYRRFGGPDNRSTACQPGNVYSADGSNLPGLDSSFAAIPRSSNGTLTPGDFQTTQGTLNKCSASATGTVLIPATHRGNLLFNGYFDLTDNTQAFFELMGSRLAQYNYFDTASVTQTAVPANNPFNPFGVPVLVDYRFSSYGPRSNGVETDYFSRLLGGFRGRWAERWDWQVAAWQTYDHAHGHESVLNYGPLFAAVANTDPAQSINLFNSSGPPASQDIFGSILYESPTTSASKLQTVNAFVRGPLFDLPAGPLDVVFGGEYEHQVQSAFLPGEGLAAPLKFSRTIRSLFAEARLPLWAAPKNSNVEDRLALTVAGRYDRYSDFGGRFTPEAGLEFRPTDTLLLRASYGKSYKAPDLTNVYSPPSYLSGYDIPPDPLRGGEIYTTTFEIGGNPNIRPQTGTSRTLGIVWSSKAIPNLQVSLTNFRVTQADRIVQPNLFLGFDQFPADLITRASPTAADIAKGYAGKVVLVDQRYSNLGGLLVQGYDLDINYKFDTSIGAFSPSLATTEYYKYQAASFGAAKDVLGYANADTFAPRWKGTVALNWTMGPWSARVAGRYLSKYEDYDLARTLGDFWLFDASARYNFGHAFGSANPVLSNAYAQLSITNVADRPAQYSNYFGIGYDPREGDVRGRFVSFTIGTRW